MWNRFYSIDFHKIKLSVKRVCGKARYIVKSMFTWFMAVPRHLATRPSKDSCSGICSAGIGPFGTSRDISGWNQRQNINAKQKATVRYDTVRFGYKHVICKITTLGIKMWVEISNKNRPINLKYLTNSSRRMKY